jgi:hypothetical protein
MNNDMENHPYLNHSKQKIEIVKSSYSPSQNLHPTCDKRERDVRGLDLKGLVGKYLGTQDLNIT